MTETRQLDLHRKIIATMTGGGWRDAPHAGFNYEPEVSALLETLEAINAGRGDAPHITLNTALLKIIAEGVKAAPSVNGHIHFNRLAAGGKVTTFSNIDVTMPVAIGPQLMFPLNVRGVESLSLTEIQNAVADLLRRMKNSHLQQAFYEVSLHDTMTELKHLRVCRALGRLLGFWLEGGPKTLLHGAAKRAYLAIPETERLTRRDLEQGTIMVSNPGSLNRGQPVRYTILDLIPPQITAICIGPVQSRPVVGADGALRAGKVLPMTIIHDHRATDAADFVPMLERMDAIFAAPEVLRDML